MGPPPMALPAVLGGIVPASVPPGVGRRSPVMAGGASAVLAIRRHPAAERPEEERHG